MKRSLRIFLFLIATLIGSLMTTSHPIHGQNISRGANSTQIPPQEDIFRVLLMLFGIKNDTGNVVSFVEVNNVTAGKLFNATKEDMRQDNTSIVDTLLSFPNETVPTGAEYKACIVVLKIPNIICAGGYNSPGPRTEIEQFALQ